MMSFHYIKPESKDGSRYGRGFVSYDESEAPEMMAEIASQFCWSPIVWEEGVRRGENFVKANWLVLDFDDGRLRLEDACKEFSDMWHWIGTTWSHTPEKHRFRVAIRWAETITDPDHYRQNVIYAMNHYPADKSCKDTARYFFPSREIVQFCEGSKADVWAKVQQSDRVVPVKIDKSRVIPSQIKILLGYEWAQGTRNSRCFIVAKEMFKRGFESQEILSSICKMNNYNTAEILRTIASAERNLAHEVRKKG